MKVPEYMREKEKRAGGMEGTHVILGLVIGLCVINVAVLVGGWQVVRSERREGREGRGWSAWQERTWAAKLLAEGLREQAVEAFERYIARGEVSSSEVANVSYMMGKAMMEEGRYEDALGYFYRAEVADGGSKAAAEARRAVVVCLERLGRMVDARYALDRETALQRGGATQEVRGVVVAKVGDEEITMGEINDYIQRMPAGRQKEMDTAGGREEVLRQIVMERLLYKRGQMAGIDRSAEVKKRVAEIERQMIVERVMKEEIERRVKVTDEEVRKYYEGNKGRFGKVEGGTNGVVEVPRFEVVRGEVERAYRAEKEREAVEQMVEEMMKAYRVEIYAERLGGRE